MSLQAGRRTPMLNHEAEISVHRRRPERAGIIPKSCDRPIASQMTLVKNDSTGTAGPWGVGRPVALTVLCTMLFLTFLDNTVVSVGLGSVQADLHAGVLALQWVVGAYTLTFASAMLAFGTVGDKFGRKKVMLAGAGVFCAGSVLCALAPDAGLLIAGRGSRSRSARSWAGSWWASGAGVVAG